MMRRSGGSGFPGTIARNPGIVEGLNLRVRGDATIATATDTGNTERGSSAMLIRRDRRRWTRSILTALVAAPLVGLAAWADQPEAKGVKKAQATGVADDAKKSDLVGNPEKGRMAREAILELEAALKGNGSGKEKVKVPEKAKAPAVALPDRPKKTITPPTLDSAAIDALLDKSLVSTKTPVSPMTSDEEFVRRVYLDVTGKLPTIDEMRSFVQAKDKAKRAKLIEHLLKSGAYSENWARYWRDVVSYRAPNTNANQINYPAFEAWLAGELAKNRPWDEIVTAIITAEGPTNENGASAFGLAETSQPVEMAGEVSRVFMGVQIQCAQCHDHPNDPWKREQFHEFAAFFAGLKQRRFEKAGAGMPAVFELFSAANVPRYTMPDLKDPTKQIPIAPKFFIGDGGKAASLAGLKDEQRRQLAASYVTGQDNPWFAKAFVNRVWGTLMGEGFYSPIDDLGPTKEAHNPEVLEALASEWQKGGYDIQWLFRTILNTRAYQRESRSTNSAAGRTPFASNCPTRLRADQIFDALAQALDLPLDTLRPRALNAANPQKQAQMVRAAIAKKGAEPPKATQEANAANVALRKNAPRNQFNKTFGVDPSTPNDDVLGTIPQALYLMNSPALNQGLKAAPNTMLGQLLSSTPDNRAVLEVLYLRVLARRPNAKEVAVCGRYVENVGNRVEAFEDILWSLINSTEFVSRR
jgi:hypothetical protein